MYRNFKVEIFCCVRNNKHIQFSLLCLFFTILAFYSASFWPDDQDGVNFLLGIEFYHPEFHQPHFPGYPVYIAAGKLLTLFTGNSEVACVILSLLSGVASLLLLTKIIQKSCGQQTALLCAVAMAVNTVFFEFSHKIFTEIPALALLLAAVLIMEDPCRTSGLKLFFGCFLLGLLLGVRLSWWPFVFFYILYGLRLRKGVICLCGVFAGVAIWLIPQVSIVGFNELVSIGISFTTGHFTKWGGAVVSNGMPLWERLMAFTLRVGEVLGWVGTGTYLTRFPWIIFTVFGILIILRSKETKNRQITTFIKASLLYMLWVVLGQNPEKVRHVIPLIPVFILILSPVIRDHFKKAAIVIIVLSLTLFTDYIFRIHQNPPAIRFRQWVESGVQPFSDFYCGQSERLFDKYSTKHRIINVINSKDLMFKIKSAWPEPEARFVCNDIPGLITKTKAKPVAVFPARRGDPVDKTLRIYKIN